jgi:hypothetical protein
MITSRTCLSTDVVDSPNAIREDFPSGESAVVWHSAVSVWENSTGNQVQHCKS